MELSLLWLPGCATCLATKGFLEHEGISYRSLNVHENPEAKAAWQAAGEPILPAVLVDDKVQGILHYSQLRSYVDVDIPAGTPAQGLVWDIATIQQAWLNAIEPLDDASLVAPTRCRGRSITNLAVNAFRAHGLVIDAWSTGSFPWGAGDDEKVEERLIAELTSSGGAALATYAQSVAARWSSFALEHFSETPQVAPREITHPEKGTISFDTLLLSQRWHAALHLKQVLVHCDEQGLPCPDSSVIDTMHGLDLPAEVF